MSVFMIAWSGIKRKKGIAISTGILIFMAAAMFDVGLTLLAGVGSFYDRENDRLMGSHYMVRFDGDEYQEDYLEFFQKDERVESAETQEIVLMNLASFPEGGVISPDFLPIEEGNSKGYQIVEEADVPESQAIYAPVFFKDMGYRLGDWLVLEFNKEIFKFQIAGFSQSTWFQSSVSSLVNFYMPRAAYEQLYERVGGGYLLMVRVHDLKDIDSLKEDFKSQTDVNIEAVSLESGVMDIDINEMRQGSTMVVTILSAVLFVFSFLIVITTVIVVRFRIRNHIESQMVNLGAMGALGYTGRQIQWSIAIEFLIIGLAATVLGIAASYGIIACLGGIITSSVGVAWRGGIHGGYDAASALLIMGIVLLISVKTAKRAARIQPVLALRGGIKNHNFEKSYFPLEHTKGSLPVVLGLKHAMFQKKTYAMVGIIFMGITFACGFAAVTYFNMGMNSDLAVKLTGYEICDIMVYTAPHTDYDALVKELEGLAGVRKTSLYESGSGKVEGELLTCYVSDDYGKMEMVEVYRGSFPRHDNEIAITGVLAKSWGKDIGDSVRVETAQGMAEYVISGLGQTMSNFGRQCFLSLEGMKRISPAYERHTIQIYLEPGIEIDEYIKKMESEFKILSPTGVTPEEEKERSAKRTAEEKLAALLASYGVDSAQYALMVDGEIVLSGDTESYVIDRIENNRRLFVSNVDTVANSISIMSAIILASTLFIMVLVLYMVIKSLLVRQKHEFGIYKALGYTDRQLMEEIAASFLPVSAAGTVFGCVLASLCVNRIASLMFEQLGISNMEMAVNPFLMAGMGILIVSASYGISMVIARKIKGITVYGLLTEE